MTINIKQNLANLKAAEQLIKLSYENLKNVQAFKEANYGAEGFATVETYARTMRAIADLIKAAEGAL